MCKRRGVTLLETIIYLGLLSVVALIATMNISNLMEKRMKNEAISEFEEINKAIILESIKCRKQGIDSSVNFNKEYITIGEKNKIEFENLEVMSSVNSYYLKRNGQFDKDFKIEFKDNGGEVYKIIGCKKCGEIHR